MPISDVRDERPMPADRPTADDMTLMVRLSPAELDLLRRYQEANGEADLSTAAWQLMMSAVIEWDTRRRRQDRLPPNRHLFVPADLFLLSDD